MKPENAAWSTNIQYNAAFTWLLACCLILVNWKIQNTLEGCHFSFKTIENRIYHKQEIC